MRALSMIVRMLTTVAVAAAGHVTVPGWCGFKYSRAVDACAPACTPVVHLRVARLQPGATPTSTVCGQFTDSHRATRGRP
jgi:hypothetical protein